ncbi:hypothetical protein ACSNOI_23730 [Actinomadura kijaniata]|uniref:hypothetical protein n=1 Tax=Actinomadura kijaniata TaxID=46161 RepID=UPI003F192F47
MAAAPEGDGTRFAVLGAVRPAVLGPVRSVYGQLLGVRRGQAFGRRVALRTAAR